MCRCPAHDDRTASLSLDDRDSGGVLVKCFANCSNEAVVAALKERGLWPKRHDELSRHEVKPKVVDTYTYHDAEGNVIYWKERLEPGRGGRSKEFRFKHIDPTTGEIAFGHGKHNPHVLYNLPAVIRSKSVLFVEGEKQADLLAKWGLVATTLDAGSTSTLTPEMVEQLAGKRIAILPDNDEPGLGYALNNARALKKKYESLKIVKLPVLPLKGDIIDWTVFPGNDKAALLALIKATEEWEETSEAAPMSDQAPSIASEGGQGEEWPEPQPLETKVLQEPYPIDAFPATIRAAVEEVQAFIKAPVPLIASAALAALSLAVQAQVDVKRAEKLTGPVSLFLLTIADSGERKSTCDGFFTKAIREHELKQAEEAKPLIKDYKAAMGAWEAKQNGIKDSIRQLAKKDQSTREMENALREHEYQEPEPPRVPRLIYADATPEALKWNLAKQWPSGGVVSSEAGVVFGSHGMNSESAMRNLATLNLLWDGADMPTERRASESFTVRGARLTMALQVQEATLRSFFDKTGALARGTGFLARFLISWPESTQGFRLFTEAPENWPSLAVFNRRIAEILAQPSPINDDGALTPIMLPMQPDAKAAWIVFHDAIETELVCGGELYDVRDVASKTADNAARLAALLQVFEHGHSAVSIEAFESASRITAWHLNEARRFLGELALPTEVAGAGRLDAWLLDYCRREGSDTVPVRKVQQFGPSGLRGKAAMEVALEGLKDLGRVRCVKDGKRRTIQLNPMLLG